METTAHVGAEPESPARARRLLLGPLAFSMFFVFGSIASLNDVLMPKLKELFQLALIVPAFCYAGITAFGWFAHRQES